MSNFRTKLINFKNALDRLEESVVELEKSDDHAVIRDGVIQRFEFTYELAWKATKAYLEDIGLVDRNSPKAVIKEAYAQKLIFHEQYWLAMLDDRNKTVHVYNEQMATDIVARIIDKYIPELRSLVSILEKTFP